MSINFYKRIKVKDGFGANISKSGISTSYRGRYGSFGTRGFSLKTGIPGLTFRQSWSGKDTTSKILIFLLVGLLFGIIYIACLLIYNFFAILFDLMKSIARIARIRHLEKKLKKHEEQFKNEGDYFFVKFNQDILPLSLRGEKVYLKQILKNEEFVQKDTLVGELIIGDKIMKVYTPKPGILKWYKLVGQ